MIYPTTYEVTPCEFEVWELLAAGATHSDVAAHIRGPDGKRLSPRTINNHVTRLLHKVGVDSALQLVVVWYGGDLLHPARPRVEQPTPAPPRPLAERHTLFPTRGARGKATGLSEEEHAARRLTHPWRADNTLLSRG